jgi:hypothetical protein
MLGEPHIVEPGELRRESRLHRGIQHIAMRLPRELCRQQQHSSPHPASIRDERFSISRTAGGVTARQDRLTPQGRCPGGLSGLCFPVPDGPVG